MRGQDSGIVNAHSGIVNTDSGKDIKVFTITPELVFTLEQNGCSRCARIGVHVRAEYAQRAVPKNSNGNIGVCLHSRWGYVEGTEAYLQHICAFAKSKGRRVTFFVTNMHEDATLVYRIIQFKENNGTLDIELPRTVNELTAMLGGLDLVISDRLHAILISMIMGTTILPLATRDKLVGYCQYLELENYLDGKETAQILTQKLSELFENKANLDLKIASFVSNAYEGVSRYYLQSLAQSLGDSQMENTIIASQ